MRYGIWDSPDEWLVHVLTRDTDALNGHLDPVPALEHRDVELAVTMHGLLPGIDSLDVCHVEDVFQIFWDRGPHHTSAALDFDFDHYRSEIFHHLLRRCADEGLPDQLGVADDWLRASIVAVLEPVAGLTGATCVLWCR